jgi:WD40 repeat protein
MSKRKLPVLLLGGVIVGLLLVGAHSSTAQGQTVLTLSSLDVGVAETGVIEGRVDCGSSGCGGFKITLSFDRSLIRIEEATVGPVLGDQVFVSENTVDNAAGTVQITAAATVAPPAGADNLLFSLTVYGLKPGTPSLTVDSLEISGADGAPVSSTAQVGAVTVFATGKIAFFNPPKNGWEVAFVSQRDGNPEIYVVSADGRNTRRLTENDVLDGGPTWSPAGDQIAFHTARDGNMEIYVMDPNGGSVQRLTNDPAADTEPAWSPDGSQIAFVSDRDGNPEIYVMNADGSNPQRLTNDPAADTSPAWSPDGSQIAFSSNRGGSSIELYVMKTDGSGVQQISNLFGANGWYPAWAPDGHLLSFTSERSNQADVYTMDDKGQDIKRLTKETSWLTSTDWSPDGGWIAYMAGYDGDANLFVMDNTGTDVFRLTDNPADDTDPDWRPAAVETCFAVTTKANQIDVRVGPGTNRGVFGTFPANQDIRVIGQAYDENNVVWWEIDKNQIPGGKDAESLWVNSDDVGEKGDCLAVGRVEAPPVIFGAPTPLPPGTWGACGSCECGHPGECVTSPTGECLWDPATCHPGPSDGSGCAHLTTQVNQPERNYGSISVQTAPNCDDGYYPGTAITVTANTRFTFAGWSGTCGASGGATTTFTIHKSCTLIASFQ